MTHNTCNQLSYYYLLKVLWIHSTMGCGIYFSHIRRINSSNIRTPLGPFPLYVPKIKACVHLDDLNLLNIAKFLLLKFKSGKHVLYYIYSRWQCYGCHIITFVSIILCSDLCGLRPVEKNVLRPSLYT